MNLKTEIMMCFLSLFLLACNRGNDYTVDMEDRGNEMIPTPGGDQGSYDPERGIGKYTHVDVSSKPNVSMAAEGEKIYRIKCAVCHKLIDEKSIGPGMQGISIKHKPEWIMNFITNTNEMLKRDPRLLKLREAYHLPMPDENLSDNDARQLLEFMRKNDSVK